MASRALLLLRLHRSARRLSSTIIPTALHSPLHSKLHSSFPHSFPSPRHFSWWNPKPPPASEIPPPQPPQNGSVGDDIIESLPDKSAHYTLGLPADPSDINADPTWGGGQFAEPMQDVGDLIVEGSFKETASVAINWASPSDLTIAILDALHNVTGFPWWLTISCSAILIRVLLLPVVILQLQKVVQIKNAMPKLPLPVPTKGSGKSIVDQYRLFTKRRHELGCPSFTWFIGPQLFLQAPLFLVCMYTLRRMAFEQHSDLTLGGALWFTDLTVPGHGSIGAILPFVVAAAYLANVQVSFMGSTVKAGLAGTIMKFWKRWVQVCSILIFMTGYHLPQASHMFWVPFSIWSLGQSLLLQQPQVCALLIGADLQKKIGATGPLNSHDATKVCDYDKLLMEAGEHVSRNHFGQAIPLLENAIREKPENPEAYALLGQLYAFQQHWSKADNYYKHAISKGKTNEFLIAAYAGSGIALLNQGKTSESIDILRTVRSFDVPLNPTSRYGYYHSLVVLSRALVKAGLKAEALEVLREVVEYDSSVRSWLTKLEEETGVNGDER